MRVFYDWEFLEDGETIDPISIGMVAEDGREYYAVFESIQSIHTYNKILEHKWVMDNVIPHLPLMKYDNGTPMYRIPCTRGPECEGHFYLDMDAPEVKSTSTIKAEIQAFLDSSTGYGSLRPGEAPRNTYSGIELWGYYSAYDHVRLAQMFGPMIKRPESMPMFTCDLAQVLHLKGIAEKDWHSYLPPQPENAHNALADARWVRDAVRMIL